MKNPKRSNSIVRCPQTTGVTISLSHILGGIDALGEKPDAVLVDRIERGELGIFCKLGLAYLRALEGKIEESKRLAYDPDEGYRGLTLHWPALNCSASVVNPKKQENQLKNSCCDLRRKNLIPGAAGCEIISYGLR